MAKLERTLNGDFDNILNTITRGIQSGSITASLEESSDFYADGARCSVRIFEHERNAFSGGRKDLYFSFDLRRKSGCILQNKYVRRTGFSR